MVFRDHYRSQNIHWKFVRYENLFEYQAGIRRIESSGWQIKAIVCDGRRGLFNSFGEIPVQMCHFHQISIVTRYLTQKPKLPAGRELKDIVATLPQSDRSNFENSLEQWHQKWTSFLSEKSIKWETGKQTYTHRRIRSAYRSLKTNLPYLFTYQNYPDLHIPNTTNSLERVFSNLKTKLRNHTGLKYHRKAKLISEILSN